MAHALLTHSFRRRSIVFLCFRRSEIISAVVCRGKGELTPEESALGVKQVCDTLTPEDSGKFLDWKRRVLAW